MARKYVIGLDYGTESGRALLVAVDNGEEVATAMQAYPDGVIDVKLPGSGKRLEPDWALQNPRDYLHVIEQTIPQSPQGVPRTRRGRHRNRDRFYLMHNASHR